MYMYLSGGLMQLHVNQHLYTIAIKLAAMLKEVLDSSSDINLLHPSQISSTIKVNSNSNSKLESTNVTGVAHGEGELMEADCSSSFTYSEDDLRNGSFTYIVMKG